MAPWGIFVPHALRSVAFSVVLSVGLVGVALPGAARAQAKAPVVTQPRPTYPKGQGAGQPSDARPGVTSPAETRGHTRFVNSAVYTPFSRRQTDLDGRTTVTLFPAPAFRSTSAGWKPTQSRVVASASGGVVAEAPEAYAPVRFGDESTRLLELSLPGGGVLRTAADNLNLNHPDVTADGVTYGNVRAGVDLRYTVAPAGVKEELVLADPSAAARSYAFDLTDTSGDLGDLTGNERDGFAFQHGTSDGVAVRLPAPVAFGQADGMSSALAGSAHMSVVKRGHGVFRVTVSVDKTWLQGQSYPIVLDPSVVYGTLLGDVQAFTGDGGNNTNLLSANGESLLRVGSADWRSYLKFDFNALDGNDHFATATLHLQRPNSPAGCFPTASTNCDTLGLTLDRLNSAVTGTDTGQTAKARSNPADTAHAITIAPSSSGLYDNIPVDAQMHEWMAGTATNYGWSLRPTTVPSTGLGAYLLGPNSAGADSTGMPYISVDYEDFYSWATPTAPSTAVTSRRLGTASYDWQNNQVVLFGGTTGTSAFDAAGTFFTAALNDTWLYNGTTWTQVNYATSGGITPPKLVGASMAYDPIAKATYLFGGRTDTSAYNGTTYKWDGTKWTTLAPTTSPSARAYASLAFLPTQNGITGALYLYGGKDATGARNDLWRWNPTANSWAQVTVSGPAMPTRFGANLIVKDLGTFTSTGNGSLTAAPLVLFGGETGGGTKLNDTYELLPTSSTAATLTLETAAAPAGLTPRRFASAAWSANQHWGLLAGGQTGTGYASDYWYYGHTAQPGSVAGWDGNSTGGPATRAEAASAFDVKTGEFLVIGGFNGTTITSTAGAANPGYYAYQMPVVDEAQTITSASSATRSTGDPFKDVYVPGEPINYTTSETNSGRIDVAFSVQNNLPVDVTPVGTPVVTDTNNTTHVTVPVTCATTDTAPGVRCMTVNNYVTLVNYTLQVGHTATMVNSVVVSPFTTNCTSLANLAAVGNVPWRLAYDRDPGSTADDGVLGYAGLLGNASMKACGGGLGLENWWSYTSTKVADQSNLSVNVANGNAVLQATDSTPVQARGHLSYVLRRTYNSQADPTVTLNGSLGAGWQLNTGEAGDLTGLGLDSSQLSIPDSAADPGQLTHPASITLIDRDGTRHAYTIKTGIPAISANASTAINSGLGLLNGGALSIGAGAAQVCLDAAYQAPAGVHLALWRYIKLGGGSCAAPTGTSSILGYASERPDRLHAEYNASGFLTDLIDAAGVDLRYVYAGNDLTTVYEPRTCTGTPTPAGSNTNCRGFRFSRSAVGSTTTTTVTDPAGRDTSYDSYLTGPAGSVTILDRVVNPNNHGMTVYTYSGDQHVVTGDPTTNTTDANVIAKLWGCSSTLHQLCSVRDANGTRTYLHYTSGGLGLTGVGESAVDTVTDRRGTSSTLAYTASAGSAGARTIVTTGGTHQRAYLGIDAFDRVSALKEGPVGDATVSTYPALHETDYTWDTDPNQGTTCSWASTRQNDLCALTRLGSSNSSSTGVATPDELTDFFYDDSGLLVRQRRTLGGSTGTLLTSTTAYRRQYATSSGMVVADQSANGNGTVGLAAGSPSAPTLSSTLYTLADPLETLTPRGNEAGATVANFKTTRVLDTPAAGSSSPSNPNAIPGSNPCQSGSATGNTGLVCSMTQPLDITGGSLRSATTLHTYDTFGATLSTTKPEGGTYSYTYDSPGSLDLTGATQADGWLARVTDPTGEFVAFSYDRAGNVARTWDRNATHAAPSATYTATLATSNAPNTYTATLYGPGSATDTTGYSTPWRYPTTTVDQLGNTTSTLRDLNGNATSSTSARGKITRQTFDAGDLLQTKILPAEYGQSGQTAWTYTYDAFGNLIHSAEPNANATSDTNNPKATAYSYDTVNRVTQIDRARNDTTSTIPPGCANNASRSYAPTLPADLVCTTILVYDTVDNTIRVHDASAQNTDSSFDDLHRLVTRTTPAHGAAAPKTQYLYDADGNVLTICQPRLFSEGSGSCTSGSSNLPFTTQLGYDFADRPTSNTTFRDANSTYLDTAFTAVASTGYVPITSTTLYDRNGNVVETRAPGYVNDTSRHTLTSYDTLDRPITVQRPPHGSADGLTAGSPTTTYLQYDPSGDLTAAIAPGTASDNTNTSTRLTGYAYDPAHRRTDQATALQLTATTTSPPSFNASTLNSAVLAAYTSGTSSTNEHTRWAFDADGHITDTWEPRAFTSSGTVDDSFHTHTNYDDDGRPSSTLMPRFADTGNTTDPVTGVTTAQGTQCATGATGYPSGVHTCQSGYGYDYAGNTSTVTLPSSDPAHTNRFFTSAYTYDDLPSSVTGPDPSATATSSARTTLASYTYDGTGRAVTQTDALAHTTTISRYPDGLPQTVTAPPGTVAVQRGTGTLNHVSSYSYDSNGNITAVDQPVTLDTDDGSGTALAATTSFTHAGYTADNLTTSVTTPGSVTGAGTATNITAYGYDYDGNTSRIKSPSASAATTTSSPFKSTSNALQTINQYWPDNTVRTTLQPVVANAGAGDQFRRTRYAYDPAGRTSSQSVDLPTANTAVLTDTSALTGTQAFSYYPNDQLNIATARGTTPETISHAYDAAGHATSITDTPTTGPAVTSTMSWYLDGLLRTNAQSSRSTAYSYNGNGTPLARADSDGTTTNTATFTYGDADQITLFHDASGLADTNYSTDKLGRIISQTDVSNSVVAAWTYNPDNTLGQHQVSKTGVTLAQQSYTYDELARQLTQTYTGTDTPAGITSTYTYNRSGTVRGFRNGSTATVQNATWDNNNNRLTWKPSSSGAVQTWTYRADDAISTGPSGTADTTSHTYAYDPFGNQTNDGCRTLTVDGFDRTTQRGATTGACGTTSPVATYTYDGLDRQVTHTDGVSGPVTTEYYSGPSSTVLAETTTGGTAAGSTTYTLDNTNTALGLTRTNTTGDTNPPPATTQRLYDDGHRNIATVTTSGVSTCQNRYDPFGSGADGTSTVTACTAPPALPLSANTRGYIGMRRDSSAGSYQMGSRTYDPSKASFTGPDNYRNADPTASAGLNVDPLTANHYGYVNGDPVNVSDPSGHRPTCDDPADCRVVMADWMNAQRQAEGWRSAHVDSDLWDATRLVSGHLQWHWDSTFGAGAPGGAVLPALPRSWRFCAGTGTYTPSALHPYLSHPGATNCVQVPANTAVEVNVSFPLGNGSDDLNAYSARVKFKFASPQSVKNPNGESPVDSVGNIDLGRLDTIEQDLPRDNGFDNANPHFHRDDAPCSGLNFSAALIMSVGVACGQISLGIGPQVGVGYGGVVAQDRNLTHSGSYQCGASFGVGFQIGVGMKGATPELGDQFKGGSLGDQAGLGCSYNYSWKAPWG
jgi:RHS repeat-associated protein